MTGFVWMFDNKGKKYPYIEQAKGRYEACPNLHPCFDPESERLNASNSEERQRNGDTTHIGHA